MQFQYFCVSNTVSGASGLSVSREREHASLHLTLQRAGGECFAGNVAASEDAIQRQPADHVLPNLHPSSTVKVTQPDHIRTLRAQCRTGGSLCGRHVQEMLPSPT